MNDFGYAVPGTTNGPDANQVFGNHGEEDFWVIKTDSSGAFMSQHCYGGSRADVAACGTKTREGGFIVAGFTVSNDGDVIGQHMYYDSTQAAWINSTDAWVLKFDSTLCCNGPKHMVEKIRYLSQLRHNYRWRLYFSQVIQAPTMEMLPVIMTPPTSMEITMAGLSKQTRPEQFSGRNVLAEVMLMCFMK
ncbi:MAG: hypothetical protein IPJ66_20000 [Bacteroidetes bacterium]|nr:hypothetical protein [Bacteroidota bacterium]